MRSNKSAHYLKFLSFDTSFCQPQVRQQGTEAQHIANECLEMMEAAEGTILLTK